MLEKPAEDEVPVPAPRPKARAKKAIDLPAIERRNWLIHQHFVRKEVDTCKRLIKEQLIETAGECTYALYVQSMICRSEGNITDSTDLLQACKKLESKNPEILKQIARNCFLVGKYEDAIKFHEKAAAVNGKEDWEIFHQLGVCFMHLKEYEKAERNLNQALSLSRHDITFSTLANMYLEQNQMEKAIKVLKAAVSFAPENLDLLTTLGLLHLREQNFHESFELLGQAMTFDPENYKAILAAGSLMQTHGDFDVALTKYRVAAQKSPESAALWNNIAMCFFGKKKYVAAVSCLKRATYLAPFDWKILYNLSLLHLTMQQYASAFQFGSSALRLKPANANIYLLLAVALTHLGEIDNARKSYSEAYNLDPKNAHVVINYATFLHQHNENKQALKLVRDMEKVLLGGNSANNDKELQETVRKLDAALQVGGQFVEQSLKLEKEKKKSSKSRHTSKSVERMSDKKDDEMNDISQNQGQLDVQSKPSSSAFHHGDALPPVGLHQTLPSVPQGRLPSLNVQKKRTPLKRIPEPLG